MLPFGGMINFFQALLSNTETVYIQSKTDPKIL